MAIPKLTLKILAFAQNSVWSSTQSTPLVWQNQCHSYFHWPHSFPSRSLPLLGFYPGSFEPTAATSNHPLSLGLYVDDFVYISKDPVFEALFCHLLAHCKVGFMGIIEWFLSIHFSWRVIPSSVTVHLNQSGFASNLVKSFFRNSRDPTPMATPYCSDVPINSIAPSDEPDDFPAFICRQEAYQSLVGSMGWLALSTRPDLTTVHSFLSSYSNKPSVGHMKAALYALHYIHSTNDYDISFTSKSVAPMHCYVHYHLSTDVEAYSDAIPPTPINASTRSSYSDACWGSQIGSVVADGTLLPLFKFRSMIGGIIFKNGDPLGWLSERQDCTSLSSCKAEICVMIATSKNVVVFRNLCCSTSESGHLLSNTDTPTVLYQKQGCLC